MGSLQRYFISEVMLCALTGSWLMAVERSRPSLDERLLKSLESDLFSELLAPKAALAPKPDNTALTPGDPDHQRLSQSGGTDVGPPPPHLLREVAETMNRVHSRLAKQDTAAETQRLQSSIIEDFDTLIGDLQRQQQRQQKSRSQSSAGDSQASNQSPGSSSASNRAAANSNSPARDSTDRLGSDEAAAREQQARDRLLDEAWGNLPATVRQQMNSSRPERFLPKYSRLIEEYFKRLAEEEP